MNSDGKKERKERKRKRGERRFLGTAFSCLLCLMRVLFASWRVLDCFSASCIHFFLFPVEFRLDNVSSFNLVVSSSPFPSAVNPSLL